MQASHMNMRLALKITLMLSVSTLLIYASFVSLKNSVAAPITLSGTCGGVFGLRTAADGAIGANDYVGINAGAYINFTNQTISFAITDQTLSGGVTTFSQGNIVNKSFTLSADPELADAYQMTIPAGADLDNPIVVRLIPVNSGNTILIQGKSLGATGMCQKV